jgi:D-glycero-D-manno-heptose 1,7-bisphosphate phosphatase
MGADRRAVFLDRDGVINRNVFNPATREFEAPLTVKDFALLPGVCEALLRLQSAGFLLFLVSNQPNIAKRKSTLEELRAIDEELRRVLKAREMQFAAHSYCLHHPDGEAAGYSGKCACRKPSPYFLLRARREFGVDLGRSWIVGDRATDILCGRAAGVRTILIDTNGAGCGPVSPDRIAADLGAAADIICAASTESAASGWLSKPQVEPFRTGRNGDSQAVADCRSF